MRSALPSKLGAHDFGLVHACVLVLLAACGDSTSAPPRDGGPAVSPQVVDVSFCSGAQPSWVAFQDGDGSWTRTLPTLSDGRFRFRHAFISDRAGMAMMRPAGEQTMLFVQYAAPAELAVAGDTSSAFCATARPKSLLGRVAGLDTSDVAVSPNPGINPTSASSPKRQPITGIRNRSSINQLNCSRLFSTVAERRFFDRISELTGREKT